MVNMRADSPTSRRIVLAFLDFLQSVELAPGVDSEAIDVVKYCLQDIFKLDSSSGENICPGLLFDLFTSREIGRFQNNKSDLAAATQSTAEDHRASEATNISRYHFDCIYEQFEGSAGGIHGLGGVFRDELFGRFYVALAKVNFFASSPGGSEDPERIAKATRLFDEAWTEIESSQGQVMNLGNIAEVFKLKGNENMRMKLHSEAIELYTCAIALCEKAVYYGNRAAAYIDTKKYAEAIEDCLKSIEIDPNYTKAYSRLGSAYFAQGNYSEALENGYMRALALDPTNRTIRENIEVSKKRLMEQQAERAQHARARRGQGSNAQAAGSSNNSLPFPIRAPTPEFVANIFRSMAPGHAQDSSSQSSNATNSNPQFTSFPQNTSILTDFGNFHLSFNPATGGSPTNHGENSGNVEQSREDHDEGTDENVTLNFAGSLDQVSDALRSVMGMFSSQSAPNGGVSGDDTSRSHQ